MWICTLAIQIWGFFSFGGNFPQNYFFHIHLYRDPLSATPPKLSIGLSWNLIVPWDVNMFTSYCNLFCFLLGGVPLTISYTYIYQHPLYLAPPKIIHHILITPFWFLHFDVGICGIIYILLMFYISNGKQLNFHSVSFHNSGGEFVFDIFLVIQLKTDNIIL